MVTKLKIIWPPISQQQLRDAYNHIKKDSLQNADKVRKAIAAATNTLSNHPLKHPLDKYKVNNDGNFRAFELYHFRIAYQITQAAIVIVRVRHSSMEPLNY